MGYSRLSYDRSVFVKRDENGDIISYMCVHVDDLLVVDRHRQNQKILVEGLTKAYGKVTLVTGERLIYLGVDIHGTLSGFRLNQKNLINSIQYRSPKRRVSNPSSADLLARKRETPAEDPALFRSVLMKILYAASRTRMDLLFVTNALASHQHDCSGEDEEALAQLVQFLQDTSDWDLFSRPTATY
jgi:hypothetical protein